MEMNYNEIKNDTKKTQSDQDEIWVLLDYKGIILLYLYGYKIDWEAQWNPDKTIYEFLMFLKSHPKTYTVVNYNNQAKELHFDIIIYESEKNSKIEYEFMRFYSKIFNEYLISVKPENRLKFLSD